MATAKNMKELAALINKQIKQSLKDDVGKKVVEVAKEHVQTDVYNVYSPKEYERTGKLKESFVVNETSDGIEIENTRKDGNRDIVEIIEHGHDESAQGYEYPVYYPDGDNYIQERPFIENTRQQIKKENIHVNELKKSLNKNGFKVE